MARPIVNIISVFAADVVVKVVSAGTAFAVARLLSPDDYGIWVTLTLLAAYAPIFSLGTVEALLKLYPYHKARGDTAAATALESSVLGSLILACAATALLIVLVTPLAVNLSWPPALTIAMGGAAIVSFLSAFAYHRFSANQAFTFVSAIDSVRALLTFGLLTALTAWLGLPGTVFGFLAAEVAVCAISWRWSLRSLGRVVPTYVRREMAALVTTGLPITIVWWAFMLQTSSDRLISLAFLGQEETGFYGLGASFVTLVVLLPLTIGRVLYPKFNETMGRTNSIVHLRTLVVEPSAILSLMLPVAIALLVIILPAVYLTWLPRYRPGLESAQILLLGCYFTCIVRNGVNFLLTTHRHRDVLKYVACSLCVGLAANVALVSYGIGISGIAVGSSVAACVLASLVWLAVFRHLGNARRDQWRALAGLYLPYAVMLAWVIACRLVAPRALSESGMHLVTLAMLFLGCFSVALAAIPSTRRRWMTSLTLVRAQLRSRTA